MKLGKTHLKSFFSRGFYRVVQNLPTSQACLFSKNWCRNTASKEYPQIHKENSFTKIKTIFFQRKTSCFVHPLQNVSKTWLKGWNGGIWDQDPLPPASVHALMVWAKDICRSKWHPATPFPHNKIRQNASNFFSHPKTCESLCYGYDCYKS